jgi:hypothetical protein
MSHHNDGYDDQNDGDGKTLSGFIHIGFSDLNLKIPQVHDGDNDKGF